VTLVATPRPRRDRAANTPERDLAPLEALVGVTFDDIELLRAALTHPSFANEHPDDPAPTNERLEFLGDAILGAVVAEHLYQRFPEAQEGRLTEWRAQLVCGPTLARVATTQLGLGEWLRLGRGEEQTGGREREGNLERAYEAVVGAIYLDQGLEVARGFVERSLDDELAGIEMEPAELNPKGALQQLAQEQMGRPAYVILDQIGPEHDRHFTVEVRLAGEVMGRGTGSSKQEAEKQAAREALDRLQARMRDSVEPAAADESHPGAGEHRMDGSQDPDVRGSGA
jgi:ribonuclease III